MKIVKYASLSFWLLTGSALYAVPTAVPAATTPAPLAEALPILQAKYIDFKSLNYKPGDSLSDLIARSGGKITLSASDIVSPVQRVITATLRDNIIYWRLASFVLSPGKSWSDLAGQFQPASAPPAGIILDLRSNTMPDDYDGAKQVLGLFASSSAAPKPAVSRPPVVVLTNNRTVGAAEALAGSLQAQGALVVGRPTAGKVGLFQEDKLSSGQVLRYAVAATGSDDPAVIFKFGSIAPKWGHPVIPDLPVAVDDRSEDAALTLIRDNQIGEVVQESAERHRLSEASLVQGQDPEWDDYLGSLERKPVLLSLPIIHDVVLISALDSLQAIRLSQRAFPGDATANASLPASTSVQ